MNGELEIVPGGGVTTPRGFTAGATRAGVRLDIEKLDLGIIYSEVSCAGAGVYTRNRTTAAPVLITRQHLSDGLARAVVANSGCANAATGQQGLADSVEMARLVAERLGIDQGDVVVASTGVIGTAMPMDRVAKGIGEVTLSTEGGDDFARAIMTTDTKPKNIAVRFGPYALGGVAKGAGMIHPNMATMLGFVTTDAPVDSGFLAASLREAVAATFNMIDVDSDTSTNDMVVVLANGLAGGDAIDEGNPLAETFQGALTAVCGYLARAIVDDAEGGTKFIQATIEEAATLEDARKAAREIVRSLAVKTAVYGRDPNWGRILAAVGNSGAEMDEAKTALYLSKPDGEEICLYCEGSPQAYEHAEAKACLEPRYVQIRVTMGLGEAEATAWGSDITEDYVRLNSQYTT